MQSGAGPQNSVLWRAPLRAGGPYGLAIAFDKARLTECRALRPSKQLPCEDGRHNPAKQS
ncbi:hypothetical protein BN77_0909 [Rhizobium mesoamericanum STM3625]|uniref:Uncharacterized protein n=1 Tax=Rhizobium mesoamericanum STM3625 TaxID=1211777 RepID=K0Q1L6_9HYPH|nr:hypothetical protein BN77_0909 [Rhizobium mesoamericanum STM3625]